MVSLFTSQTPALTNLSEGSPLTLGTTLMFSEAGNATRGRRNSNSFTWGTDLAAGRDTP